jgi:glycosyltransferase involved in cell wall biosynthesis
LLPGQSGTYRTSAVEGFSTGMKVPSFGYYLLDRLLNLKQIRTIQDGPDGIDAYHVQSEHVGQTYAQFGFPEEKMRQVPNFLDERFLVEHRSDFSEPYRLLYVGSLIEKKGTGRLVPILSRLRDTPHDFTLTVAGSGRMESSLRTQIERAGLEEETTVLGHVEYGSLPEIYAAHDIFVYPGIWDEPFGRVFLEALATGTPIVSTPVGDVREIVGDAGAITDGTVDDFYETTLRLVEDDDLERLSASARRRAKRYRPERVVPEFESLYRELETSGR